MTTAPLLRRALRASWLALSAFAALTACHDVVVRPELLVFVDGDVTGVDSVHVDVTGPGGASTLSRTFPLGTAAGQVRFPFSLGIAPAGGDASRVVTISVEARGGETVRVRSLVHSAFVAGEVRRLDVFLAEACVATYAGCEGMSLTCRDGGCVTPMVDATTLPPAHPDGGVPTPDAGPSCMPTPLSCGMATIMADTGNGTSVRDANDCAPAAHYPGHEGVYVFTSTTPATVHLTATRISDTDHAYDLFVLHGAATACDPRASCTVFDSNGSNVDHVDFVALPDEPYTVVYDGVDPLAMTSYTLAITCDLCGDGIVTVPEQCDDRNASSGDGCAADCTLEPGFTCDGAPSVCQRTNCGDGTTQRGETCDDGNTTAGDGCSADCLAETFTAISLAAPSATITGSFDASDPQWPRPNADCVTDSAITDPHLDTYVLQNTGPTALTMSVQAAWGGDGFLFVYTPPFDATMPFAGCLTGDDDFMGPTASRIDGVLVGAGTQVILVASEYAGFSAPGPYTLTLAARAP